MMKRQQKTALIESGTNARRQLGTIEEKLQPKYRIQGGEPTPQMRMKKTISYSEKAPFQISKLRSISISLVCQKPR